MSLFGLAVEIFQKRKKHTGTEIDAEKQPSSQPASHTHTHTDIAWKKAIAAIAFYRMT